MKSLLLLAAISFPVAGHAISVLELKSDSTLKLEIRGDGRSQLTVIVNNPGPGAASVKLPAGLVAHAEGGARVATIREVTMQIETRQTGEITVPVVPLSSANESKTEKFTLSMDRIDALQPLVDLSAKQNDLPRATAQLAALILLENLEYLKWQEFLRRETSTEPRPTPADIAAAVDAISIVRKIAPERKLVLADDPEFRLRALRNPWSRAKAMQLFGMNPPEGVPIPDVNQLLHTRPGDNCPVCRLRTQASEPSNGL